MRYGIAPASFQNGGSNRRRLLFFVAASFLLGAALALLARPPRESPPAPPPPPRPSPTSPPKGFTYRNPILFADWSDPDVIRVGDDYWLVASSFHEVPGLPILHSKDLVQWEPLRLVKEARGWIDPCPFRDTDGSLLLVHAWAKSRAGFNGTLTLRRLSPDGLSVVDEGVNVFDGGTRHPTIEGPRLYRRGVWIYIFAPAGGVKTGWQTVLRSKSVLGPWEERIVLDQGGTPVNGPHQGGLVDTPIGEELVAREGAWVGSRLALFTAPLPSPTPADFTDVEWFRVE